MGINCLSIIKAAYNEVLSNRPDIVRKMNASNGMLRCLYIYDSAIKVSKNLLPDNTVALDIPSLVNPRDSLGRVNCVCIYNFSLIEPVDACRAFDVSYSVVEVSQYTKMSYIELPVG